jgi:hypothetical protein
MSDWHMLVPCYTFITVDENYYKYAEYGVTTRPGLSVYLYRR